MIVLFENSNLTTWSKCLAWQDGQWGFVNRGPVARTIFSTIYGWTRGFTPIYWGAKVGDVIRIDEFRSIHVMHNHPSLRGVIFGNPTKILR